MIVDGGNSKWTDSVARHAQCAEHGIHFVDVGTSGGVWGLEVGYCMMVGGEQEPVDRLAPILDVLRARRTGWGPDGRPRLGPLREDGPQRHRVRADAGLRRGLRAAAQVRVRRSTSSRSRTSGARARWSAPGCSSWRRGRSRPTATTSHALEGYVDDSGEGRWTLESGIDHDVPMPALTAALFARFYSRGNGDYAARMLAALRNQFGGHAVKAASESS